ncbi:endonuclease domain-containing protein [Bauldia sp.]|uniref:endonuclease domain-containing protein n=1 Tax=Bauldia sp. TaxID=2575872 RepID=UPI003BAD2913
MARDTDGCFPLTGGEGSAGDPSGAADAKADRSGQRGGHRDPSPLVGEGGPARSAGSGEGAPKRRKTKREVPEPVAFARRLRRDATPAERALWQVLRRPPFAVVKFRRQVPVGPYVADFLSYAARLIIEADGSQHGADSHDRHRDAWFAAQGWRVMRFANNEIMRNRGGVVEAIRLALREQGIVV